MKLPPSNIDRRAFLRAVAATASTVAGGSLLAACQPTTAAPSPAAPSKPAAAAPASAAAAPAVAKPAAAPLKIGVLLPQAGPFTVVGESMLAGLQLYFDSVGNQAGGRPIQLIREDEGPSGDEGLRKARKLVEQDGVDLMTGIVSTAIAYAIRDYVHENRTILLVANAGGNDLTRARKSPYVFRTSFTSWQMSFPLGEWVAKNAGRRAWLTASDYAFGRESTDAFRENFTRHGGTVVGESYPPLGNTDFAPFLTQIGEARPEAVYAFFGGADAANFVKQYAEFGLQRDIRLTGAGVMTEEDVLPAQGQAALGVVGSLFWALTLDNAENRQFTQAYRQRHNADANVFAMQAYDTARVIVEAVNKTAGDTSDKARLVETLAAVEFASPRGPFRFDKDTHQVIQDIYIREVREVNGRLTNVVIDRVRDVRDIG